MNYIVKITRVIEELVHVKAETPEEGIQKVFDGNILNSIKISNTADILDKELIYITNADAHIMNGFIPKPEEMDIYILENGTWKRFIKPIKKVEVNWDLL